MLHIFGLLSLTCSKDSSTHFIDFFTTLSWFLVTHFQVLANKNNTWRIVPMLSLGQYCNFLVVYKLNFGGSTHLKRLHQKRSVAITTGLYTHCTDITNRENVWPCSVYEQTPVDLSSRPDTYSTRHTAGSDYNQIWPVFVACVYPADQHCRILGQRGGVPQLLPRETCCREVPTPGSTFYSMESLKAHCMRDGACMDLNLYIIIEKMSVTVWYS